MITAHVYWDEDSDPRGNVQHIAINEVTKEEVHEALLDSDGTDSPGQRRGRREWRGRTSEGRPLVIPYETLSDDPWVIYPITAFEPSPRED